MTPAEYLDDLFGLSGRTAIVVGGTGTLGGAFCRALAGAGVYTIAVGRNEKHGKECVDEITGSGGCAEYIYADATNRGDMEAIVGRLKSAGRTADVLVNGAGINAATP